MIANEVLTEAKTAFPAEPRIVEHVAGTFWKERIDCNYISGIWISALKKLMQSADWWNDISNVVITLGTCFQVFFNVCLHSHSFSLRADGQKSDSSVDSKPQGNWRRNSNSRDVVASSPSCQSAPESLLTGYILCSLWEVWLIGKPVLTFKMISGGMQWVSSSYSLLLISINLHT